jgi:hypothetical protein
LGVSIYDCGKDHLFFYAYPPHRGYYTILNKQLLLPTNDACLLQI